VSPFRWLTLRRLRRRPSRPLLLVAVVAAALSPLIGVLVERYSAEQATRELGEQLAGPVPLRVVGSSVKGGLLPSTVAQIEEVPGIEAAVPMVQAIALIDGSDSPVLTLGVDCSVSALTGMACDPAASGDPSRPFTSPRLADTLDGAARLQGTDGWVGLGDPLLLPELDDVNGGRVVVLELGLAQRLFARGDRLDVIYVVADPDTTTEELRPRLAAALGDTARVLDRTDRPPGPDVAAQVSGLLGVVGVFGIAIGWLLVRNIGRLMLDERQQDIAVETAIGRTRGAVLRHLALEAVVLGSVGGALATLGGLVIGDALVESLDDLAANYSGVTTAITFTPAIALVAVAAALALVTTALALPAWRLSAADIIATPPSHQTPAGAPPLPAALVGIAATVLLAVGVLLSELAVGERSLRPEAMYASLGGLVLAVLGSFVLASTLVPRALAALARRSARAPRLHLMLQNLSGNGARMSAVALSVAFAVALAVVLGGLGPAMGQASRGYTIEGLGGRLAANTLPFNDSSLIDAKIGPRLLDELAARAPQAELSREVFLLTRARPGVDIAVMASDHPHVAFDRIAGKDPGLALGQGQAVVGAPLARALDVGVGDTIEIDAPDGVVALPVGSITENINNAGLVVTVPIDVVDDHWGWQPPDPLLIRPGDRDTSSGAVAAALEAADPRLRVVDADELAVETAAAIDNYLGPFEVLRDCLFVVVAVSAFTALTLVSLQRRREFALLAAVGLSGRQLRQVALGEAAVVSILGAVEGAAIGLFLARPLDNAASFVVGITPPLHVPIAMALVGIGLGVVVVLCGALLPASRLDNIDIQTVLQAD
jgi:putative ABC transport system permease protein